MALAREIGQVNHLPREVSMKGHSQSRRWVRIGLVVGAIVASHALNGGSAQAATLHPGSARIAAAAAPASDIVLAGFTSQQYPTFFKVSKDGRTLTVGAIALEMTCTSGAQFVLQDSFGRVRISPNGRLRVTTSIPPTAGSSGDTYSGTDSLTAKLSHRHIQVSGTWQLKVNYSFTNGMSDQCDSGPVRFTATA
jgi:hypothetical protein